MSVNNQFFSEKFIEDYVKTPSTLKKQTMMRVAVQLCQHIQLKEHIIKDFNLNYILNPFNKWADLIEKKSSALCKTLPLPNCLKVTLINCIWLIAMRLLNWNREYSTKLDITARAADQLLKPSDWSAEGNIYERQVAERLVQDIRIPAIHRYRLACVYCLEPFIHTLWEQISLEHREELLKGQCNLVYLQSNLVRLWSYYMMGKLREFIEHEDLFWKRGFEEAVRESEKTAVVYCWDKLSESTKQEVIVTAALSALSRYNSVSRSKNISYFILPQSLVEIPVCVMPTHYSDIVLFLLSQMSEEQMFKFFENSFNSTIEYQIVEHDPVFSCFLESPYQDFFVPITTKLWGILPKAHYGWLLLMLSYRYENRYNEKVYRDYDYGYLLTELWKQTPENYKHYICAKSMEETDLNLSKIMLCRVLDKEPFESRKIEIIQNILHYATLEVSQKILSWKRSVDSPSFGVNLCKCLIESGHYENLDLILVDCLPKREIADFKKKFLLSAQGREVCFWILARNNEESANLLLNWGCFSEEEISDFKPKLIWDLLLENGMAKNSLLKTHLDSLELSTTWNPPRAINKLLKDFDTDSVDRVLEWCLPCEDAQKEYKKQFISIIDICDLCSTFVKGWQQDLKYLICKLSQFLRWAFPLELDVKNYKLKLFAKGIHQKVLRKLILHKQWQDVECFVKWFELSQNEIKQLKKDVMYEYNTRKTIYNLLKDSDTEAVSLYLKWGLSDLETVKAFKKDFHHELSKKKELQVKLDQLIEDLLNDLANIESAERPDIEKRTFKEESSPCKRFKSQ